MLPNEKTVGNKGDEVSVLMTSPYGILGEMGLKEITKQMCLG